MQNAVEYSMTCPLAFTAWEFHKKDWRPMADAQSETSPGGNDLLKETIGHAAKLFVNIAPASLAQHAVSQISIKAVGLSMEIKVTAADELSSDALNDIHVKIREQLEGDWNATLKSLELVKWVEDDRERRLTAEFSPDEMSLPELVRPDIVYLVVQEGGSSTEIYSAEFDSISEAQEFRRDCERASYRTSAIIDIPRALADTPGFSEAVQNALTASLAFDYPGDDCNSRPSMR